MTKKPAQLYQQLQDTLCLRNASLYGKWTIPYVTAPISGVNNQGMQTDLERDSASVGSLLVNTLASKLANVLFPVSRPFFSVSVSEELERRERQESSLTPSEIKERLTQLPVECHKALFTNRGYAAVMQALRHLIITGNVCLYRNQDTKRNRVFGLGNFVVQRDGEGTVIQAIVRDKTLYEALPPNLKQLLPQGPGEPEVNREVTRYWWLVRDYRGKNPGYSVREFLNDTEIGEQGWYHAKACPWVFPVWNLVQGEHYAHGHVEDYATDFRLLSRLNAASLEYSMELMRVLYLVGPTAGTQVHDLQNAPNGRYVRGDPANIVPLELGNGANKLAAVDAKLDAVVLRLSKAFMYTGATRDAERVTAYELQRNAQEAESLLGGVYSTLTGEMQAPLAYLLMVEFDKGFETPLLTGDMWPEVSEGVPSLGQSNQIENLLAFAQQLAAVIPVAQLDNRFDSHKITDMLREGNSLTEAQLYLSPEQVRANEEAAAAQQAADQSLLQATNVADQSETIQQALGG